MKNGGKKNGGKMVSKKSHLYVVLNIDSFVKQSF